MHASSLENMQRCYERYLSRSLLLSSPRLTVVDIGGANVNGSYADIFSDEKYHYVAVDVSEGDGVDVVMKDPYVIPLDHSSVDLVISGQAFEHVEFFWLLFEEMARVLKPNGLMFLIVPSSGPIHRYPVDCYRFYPDSMAALAKYTGIELVDSWLDDRGPWNDLVAVFAKQKNALREFESVMPLNRYSEQYLVAPLADSAWSEEFDLLQGTRHYLEALEQIHNILLPDLYLEIGVRNGNSLALAKCEAVAVDPAPDISYELPDSVSLYTATSDYFFEKEGGSALGQNKPDLVFIDGMHLFEFVLRDFINAEKYSKPSTLIVIDDIFPNHPVQARRNRESRVWTGDVWKFYDCLKTVRADLLLIPLNTSPTGLLLVAGLDANNRTLSQQYNPLVRHYKELAGEEHIAPYIQRRGAYEPSAEFVSGLIRELRAFKESRVAAGDSIKRRLREVLSN